MTTFARRLSKGIGWTIGPYFVSTVFRFGTSIALSRLVEPAVFGVMLILITIRLGLELITDVGIQNSIVQNKDGGETSFLDTAWTLQFMRSMSLALVVLLGSPWIAALYGIEQSYIAFFAIVVGLIGFQSTITFSIQRDMNARTYNLFDTANDVFASVLTLVCAYVEPSVWGLLAAQVASVATRVAASFLVLGGRNRAAFDRGHARAIFTFGKWVMWSSTATFLSNSFDRIYLGTVVPMATLGFFGIARTIADIPSGLVGRVGHVVVFPAIAGARDLDADALNRLIVRTRLWLLLVSAVGLAAGLMVSDIFIRFVYDARYGEVANLVPVLVLGIWPTLLVVIGEYTLLALNRPAYAAVGSTVRLAYLLVAVPAAFAAGGIFAVALAVALADLPRYVVSAVGHARSQIGILRNDLLVTAVLLASLVAFGAIRESLGLGSPFAGALQGLGFR